MNPRRSFNRPTLVIFIVWLISRLTAHIFFTPRIAPDSFEYLHIANLLWTHPSTSVDINRPYGYSIFVSVFGSNTQIIVAAQQILSLLIAIQLFHILKSLNIRPSRATLLPIFYLVYPLTIYLEFQILSEVFTAFLLITLSCHLFTKQILPKIIHELVSIILVTLIALTRPNVLIVCLAILAIHSYKNLTRFTFYGFFSKSLFGAVTGILIAFSLNIHFTGNPLPAEGALRSGLAMHMLDTIPSYEDNQLLSASIIDAEVKVRQSSPGSKYWSPQAGSKSYSNSGRSDIDTALWAMDRNLIARFPQLYLQSVSSSFFSTFIADVNAFLPTTRSYYYAYFGYILLLVGFLFQIIVLIGGIFIPIANALVKRILVVGQSDNRATVIAISVALFMLLNALVSPVEQIRYLFPVIPLMIISFAIFWDQSRLKI